MTKLCLALIGLFIISCNKNSLELPPPVDDIKVREVVCSIDGTTKALVQFKQHKNDREGRVSIEVRNLAGSDLTQLKILLEICNGEPSYYSCNNQYVCFIAKLDTVRNFTQELPFRDIILDSVKLTAGIISTADKKSLLSGIYSGNYVQCENSGVGGLLGFTKGAVFADGSSVLRLGFPDILAFNITGNFIDSSAFTNGRLLERSSVQGPFDAIATPLTLDVPGTGHFNTNPLEFRLSLHDPKLIPANAASATTKFFFSLNKLQ